MEVQSFRRGYQDVFLPALEKALGGPADFSRTRDAVLVHAEAVIDRHRHDWPQSRDPGLLEFVALMIGAWRVLRQGRDDARLEALLEKALDLGFAGMTGVVREDLDRSPDAFSRLVEISKAREAGFFGEGFAFERSVENPEAYHLHVTRCWFADIARAEGVPGVAPVFCAFDAAWFRAIEPGRHRVRFRRPTTIARGNDRCRFLFDRVRG